MFPYSVKCWKKSTASTWLQICATDIQQGKLDDEMSCSEKIHALHIVAKLFFQLTRWHTYRYISTVFNLDFFFLVRFHPYLLINSFQMAICSGVRSPVLYRCKGTWCVGRGWCISLQLLSIFWVQSQRPWDNSYDSLRLSLTTDEYETADLLSLFYLKNSKMLV